MLFVLRHRATYTLLIPVLYSNRLSRLSSTPQKLISSSNYRTQAALYNRPSFLASTMVASSSISVVKEKIELTEKENEIFTALINTLKEQREWVAEDIKKNGRSVEEETVLRCAGGWVRDKLLGLDSDDIDIAINNLYGEQFAEHVYQYLKDSDQDARKVSCFALSPRPCKQRSMFNLHSEFNLMERLPS